MIPTEEENPLTRKIDRLPTIEALRLMNAEDRVPAKAVAAVLEPAAGLVDAAAERILAGGRLIYVGCGTSGRLGVLDASEIPPTFGVEPGIVIGLIAGGEEALTNAVEGVEDDEDLARTDLARLSLNSGDVVVGISASGNTPYTNAAVRFAASRGCLTAGISSNPEALLKESAAIFICPETGAEVIAGSTRLKSGTAQKMLLNMISTILMIRLGYVTGNRMTNLTVRNRKLRSRAERIISGEASVTTEEAGGLLRQAGGDLRVALVMIRAGVDRNAAEEALRQNGSVIAKAVSALRSGSGRGE